jgi:hypothetical protein
VHGGTVIMKNLHIVFVNSTVEDWESRAVGVKEGREVILVHRARDGIEQIAAALKSHKGIYSNPCRSRKFFTPPQPSPW